MVAQIVNLYTQIAAVALPIAISFEICNLIVCTFMRVAFGGKLWFGRD